MNRVNMIVLVFSASLVVACILPWVKIPDLSITISGIDTSGTRYGKPAYNHFILTACILSCTFISRIWTKRINLLFGALNFGWAMRNFVVIPACDGGICPEKLPGIYLMLFSSLILLITTLFPQEPGGGKKSGTEQKP